ncbi:hypothetical protein JTB14_007648 [Gonioctena quinquepunctata]|nr:hypothetical protein JTB14_007648 [Gonioctena quinquepunctata]
MESDSMNAIRSLREEVLRKRKEIKSAIEATETRLLMKVEELKQKVDHLEEENQTLREEAAISIAQEDPKDINTPKTIGNKKINKLIAGWPALKESQRSNK